MTKTTKTITINQYLLEESELNMCIDALEARAEDLHELVRSGGAFGEEADHLTKYAEELADLAMNMRYAEEE